jgi:hypothetical protein
MIFVSGRYADANLLIIPLDNRLVKVSELDYYFTSPMMYNSILVGSMDNIQINN